MQTPRSHTLHDHAHYTRDKDKSCFISSKPVYETVVFWYQEILRENAWMKNSFYIKWAVHGNHVQYIYRQDTWDSSMLPNQENEVERSDRTLSVAALWKIHRQSNL